MSRALYGAALALLFLVVLAARAPAYLAGYLVPDETVRMSGFSGTLWEGVASSAAVATDDGWLQLGRLQWSLSELYLLLLSPTAELQSAWGQQRFRAHVRRYPSGDLRIRGLESRFSAALIKRWLPVNLRGNINVSMDELEIGDGRPLSGRGRVVWQDATWRGTRGSRRLGDYVLEFQLTGPQQATGDVTTLAGPIVVEGGIRLDGRRYAVDATLSSDEAFDPELADALSLMAAPVPGGYELKFESEF